MWGVSGILFVRLSVRVVVGAFALAGSLGTASAQSYDSAPMPPLDAGSSSYDPGNGSQAGGEPHSAPAPRATSPRQVSARDDLPPRPPTNVGDGSSADYTGSLYGPAANAATAGRASVMAALPPEDRPETGLAKQLPPQFRRQLVDYVTSEPAGTLIIDTPHTYLYLVRGGGKALRYGIGVGREGSTWSGTERISRMSEWPDWYPPTEMIERQPYLPRFMAGGPSNPLGARALYLGNTLYRIHGTNQPSTIGQFVSSGCIRLTNNDIEDLYRRVGLGTRVVVLPGSPPIAAASSGPIAR
jgi:lipoprotein-anchoring transpeptidase ErfK/SrfK